MDTRDFFQQHAKNKERTSQYIIGKKFNTQDGDKTEQNYYVKLLPRIPPTPKDKTKGPFYEFWVHRNCGPDAAQALVCLNTDREEFKSNKRQCPACKRIRKILNSEDGRYSTEDIDRAKSQRAQNRVVWVVYDLNKRQGCEILEQSGQANDLIIGQFRDQGGDFLDLTILKNNTCLHINRKGSGINTRYQFSGLCHQKFQLTNSDAAKIKPTYAYPELCVKRLSPEEFANIYESQFEVESNNSVIDDGPTPAVDGDSNNALDDLDGLTGDAPAPVTKVSRQAQSSAPAQQEDTADLENTLDELTQ